MQKQFNRFSACYYTNKFREKQNSIVKFYIQNTLTIATYRDTSRSICLEYIYFFNLSFI